MADNSFSNRCVRGVGVSSGKASGILHFFGFTAEGREKKAPVSQDQRERLETALREVNQRLEQLRLRAESEISEEAAEIFEIHAMVLTDEDFTETLEEAISDARKLLTKEVL